MIKWGSHCEIILNRQAASVPASFAGLANDAYDVESSRLRNLKMQYVATNPALKRLRPWLRPSDRTLHGVVFSFLVWRKRGSRAEEGVGYGTKVRSRS